MTDTNVEPYAAMLMGFTDDELVHQFGMVPSGSHHIDQIKFEMELRNIVAQKSAAIAVLRGAIASEKYTRAIWFLIVVTVIGNLWWPVVNLISKLR